jgi:hypothetical protein
MKFKLSAVASDSENRGSDLMDLAHWLNGDHEPVDPPEGLLPPPQMTAESPSQFTSQGFVFRLVRKAHAWPTEHFAKVPVPFGTNAPLTANLFIRTLTLLSATVRSASEYVM